MITNKIIGEERNKIHTDNTISFSLYDKTTKDTNNVIS